MDEREIPMELEEAADEARVVKRKAEMISGYQEVSAEQYKEASNRVTEMVDELGSLEAVNDYLNLEVLVEELDIKEEFERISREVETETGKFFLQQLQVNAEEIRKRFENGDIEGASQIRQQIYQQFLELQLAIFMQRIPDSRRSILDSSLFPAMIDTWRSLQTRVINYQFQLSAAAGSPPTPPDRRGGSRPTRKPEARIAITQRREMLLSASGGKEPPPPPTPPEGDYEEVVPDNLEDVVWDNGDAIRFRRAVTLHDEEGRERVFYYATLEYTSKKGERTSVDLSRYVKGKTIIFEGTKGSICGANMDPKRYLGWASEGAENLKKQVKNDVYFVALRSQYLKATPLSLAVIFHEIGHIHIFGDIDQKVFERELNSFGKFMDKMTGRSQGTQVRGIESYRRAAEETTSQALQALPSLQKAKGELEYRFTLRTPVYSAVNRRYVTSSTPEERQQLAKLNSQIRVLRAVQLASQGRHISRDDYYRLRSSIPQADLVAKIFEERNAVAYAVKQIRRLGLNKEYSARDFLDRELGGLQTRATREKDERFKKGMR